MFLNLQKNRSQKLSILEERKTVLEFALNSAQNYRSRFSVFRPIFSGQRSITVYFWKIKSAVWKSPIIKKNEHWKSRFIVLCGSQCRFQYCLCFSSSIDSFLLVFFWKLRKKSKIPNFLENNVEIQKKKKNHEQNRIRFNICRANFIKISP